MDMVFIPKVSRNASIPLLKGVLCIEHGKYFEQSFIKRLTKIQSIMPCNFLKKFLRAFRKWESGKLRLVATSNTKIDKYIPIFEKLRGLNVLVSNVYIEMEKNIAHYLDKNDRERYVFNLLLAALGRKNEIDSELDPHPLGKFTGNNYYTVDWTDYDSFIVKRGVRNSRIICIYSTDEDTKRLTLAAIGFHDDAYLTDRSKLDFAPFGTPDPKKLKEEQDKMMRLDQKKEFLEKKRQKEREARDNWNQPLKNLGQLISNKGKKVK